MGGGSRGLGRCGLKPWVNGDVVTAKRALANFPKGVVGHIVRQTPLWVSVEISKHTYRISRLIFDSFFDLMEETR